jgi:hypothetical protein
MGLFRSMRRLPQLWLIAILSGLADVSCEDGHASRS